MMYIKQDEVLFNSFKCVLCFREAVWPNISSK
jgi:hypothetical protein